MNNTQSTQGSAINGYIAIGITQLIAGSLLLWASFYGFFVLQSYFVILPALMAVAVIGYGIHALLKSRCADTQINTAVYE